MASSQAIARLKITLDEVEPPVWRRVDVPFAIKLNRLHLVIQAAMGWTNSHLWEFEACSARWGEVDLGFDNGVRSASKATLQSAVEDMGTKKLHYTDDFGHGWEHTTKLEGLRDRTGFPQSPWQSRAHTICLKLKIMRLIWESASGCCR